MQTYQPKIAIVGAGPAGLALGVLLHRQTIAFTIYELRPKPTDDELAKPSGMLDLHEGSGLAAIRACGLFDRFLPQTAECSQSTIIADKHGRILHQDEGDLEYRPEISRHALTKLLLSQLPSENIQWETKLFSISESAKGGLTLDFGPKSVSSADFVVGADGAWSKARSILTDVKPHSSGLDYLTLTIPHISSKYPRLVEVVGSGSLFALGNNNGIISHRTAQDSARLYVSYGSQHEKESAESMHISQLKAQLLNEPELFGLWGESMKELLSVAFDEESKSCQHLQAKQLLMLPIGHTWESNAFATVIGDAAHLMLPFAGEGVNLAFKDALDLSEVIVKSIKAGPSNGYAFRGVLGPLMKDFELDMFARAKVMADETWRNTLTMFSDDGANKMAVLMKSFGPPPEK